VPVVCPHCLVVVLLMFVVHILCHIHSSHLFSTTVSTPFCMHVAWANRIYHPRAFRSTLIISSSTFVGIVLLFFFIPLPTSNFSHLVPYVLGGTLGITFSFSSICSIVICSLFLPFVTYLHSVCFRCYYHSTACITDSVLHYARCSSVTLIAFSF
jgi:hypothetical protein